MYQEEAADLTAGHLREHLQAYLIQVSRIYADQTVLAFPRTIETNNLVGGVYNTSTDKMPAYAIDLISKQFDGQSNEGLWLYNYEGHIAGVVSGNDEAQVNKMVKRHEQATEMFVKDHVHLHQMSHVLPGNDFTIMGLGFVGAAFSGAEQVDETNEDNQIWIAGFRIDLLWILSETGPGDHAAD